MPEELLDHAQVGATFEEVCCEGVAQSVWVPEESAHGARVEPPSADREEQGVDGATRQLGPSVAEIASHVVCSLFPKGHDALLPALPAHMDGLALEVHVGEVEANGLRATEPTRVEELEQRAIPKREWGVTLGELEQLVDLRGLRRVGESA